MICMGGDGQCDRPATVYVFGNATNPAGRRLTFVGAARGRHLADCTPDGARCADCAVDDLEALVQAEAGDAEHELAPIEAFVYPDTPAGTYALVRDSVRFHLDGAS